MSKTFQDIVLTKWRRHNNERNFEYKSAVFHDSADDLIQRLNYSANLDSFNAESCGYIDGAL